MKNGGTVMNERVFNSFKEYESVYFLNKNNESLVEANFSVASHLAIRAIEKHSDKLKGIKCAEPVHSQRGS